MSKKFNLDVATLRSFLTTKVEEEARLINEGLKPTNLSNPHEWELDNWNNEELFWVNFELLVDHLKTLNKPLTDLVLLPEPQIGGIRVEYSLFSEHQEWFGHFDRAITNFSNNTPERLRYPRVVSIYPRRYGPKSRLVNCRTYHFYKNWLLLLPEDGKISLSVHQAVTLNLPLSINLD